MTLDNILVFGKNGQVATELQSLAPGARFLGRETADLRDPAACGAVIERAGALDAVINAAAWTAVDAAEAEEDTAGLVNGAAPAAMARACAARGVPLVHVSTDYVFDGSGTDPWQPDSPVGPLGAYGRTKLTGEQGVVAAGGVYGILRTSWVFSAHGANFVKTMLRLGAARDGLTVVADQVGGPTPARDIAAACLTMAEALAGDPGKAGIYHFSGAPDVSWADFAREIMAQAKLECTITDIPGSEFPTPAHRPANSRMDCTTLQTSFGLARPDWRVGLTHVLQDLKGISQ